MNIPHRPRLRRTLLLVLSVLAACAAAESPGPTATSPIAPTSGPGTSSAAPSPTTGAPTTVAPAVAPLVGVGMTPRTWEGSGFPDFLGEIAGRVDLLMHAAPWTELPTAGSSLDVVATVAEQQGMGSVVVLGTGDGGGAALRLDDAGIAALIDGLRNYLGRHHPAYLGLANEVNLIASDDPARFEQVVALWGAALPVVHELSPSTKVLVTFQYEWLLGRRDGWFGGSIGEPQWDLLGRFDGADAVGITTYPSLVLDDPAALAGDYYTQIAAHTDLPVVVTEAGWTADPALPLLPGTDAEEAAFIAVLAAQAGAARVEAMVWTFVHGDQVVQPQFAGMGLYGPDGGARPALAAWLALGGG